MRLGDIASSSVLMEKEKVMECDNDIKSLIAEIRKIALPAVELTDIEKKENKKKEKAMFSTLEWKEFETCKKKDIEYFKLMKLCQSMVECPIKLTMKVDVFPDYKRGQAGFLLEERSISLFPLDVQLVMTDFNQSHESRACLFEHGILMLAPEYYKITRK